VAFLDFLTRIGTAITGGGRSPSTLELFQQADLYRRQGRFEEGAEIVAHGLRLDPTSLSGHLVAAHLHAALRKIDLAKIEFRQVLALDPFHPRALLGLARIAMEEGDHSSCKESLERALQRYPDFPEAKALQDVISGRSIPPPSPSQRQIPVGLPVRGDRLRAPAGSRNLLVLRTDGTLVVSQSGEGEEGKEALGAHMAQVFRIASATLARSGLGAFRRGVVQWTSETTFLCCDAGLILSLAFPQGVEIGFGFLQTDRLLINSLEELGIRE